CSSRRCGSDCRHPPRGSPISGGCRDGSDEGTRAGISRRLPFLVVTALVAAISGVYGLIIGSFLNVVIWRVPRKESIVKPPSHCPACDAKIANRDNVPVISWLLLRGRCRNCGTAIASRYPFVELLTAV